VHFAQYRRRRLWNGQRIFPDNCLAEFRIDQLGRTDIAIGIPNAGMATGPNLGNDRCRRGPGQRRIGFRAVGRNALGARRKPFDRRI
jgi:hypothetical protein